MYDIRPSEEIEHRNEFSLLCNWRRLERALEIGTDRAAFATEFLRHWCGHSLICVDPYVPYREMPWDRESDYLMAVASLQPFANRVRLIRQMSHQFIQQTAPLKDMRTPWYEYDFVYIDGAHHYEAVKADLNLVWDRMSHWGILAGHDFDNVDHPGVVKAVMEFAQQHDLYVRLTRDKDGPPSWYVYKTEPGPNWRRINIDN